MSKFKRGDEVRILKSQYSSEDLKVGKVLTVVASDGSSTAATPKSDPHYSGYFFHNYNLELVKETDMSNKILEMSKVKVHKLVRKVNVGYRCVTNDYVIFETCNQKGMLTIEAVGGERILVDLTPHTIDMLSEFIRYIKTDNDTPPDSAA